MNLLIKIQTILILALGIALFVSVKSCQKNEALADDYKARLDYQDSTVKVMENKINVLVAENKTAVTSNEKTIKELSQQVRQIKTVTALVQGHQVVTLRDTLIDFIEVLVPADSSSLISVPRNFAKVTPHYTITGTITKQGVNLDSLVMKNTMSFRIGERRNNIFRPSEVVVQAINSNPHFQTVGLQSITVTARPNAWNRWIKPTLTAIGGAAAGGYISNKFFQ
jgi:hypothetical protein